LDHIVFYKNADSLKDHFAQYKFSYTREHTFYFATIYDQIGKVLTKIGDEFLLLYFVDQLEEQDKIRLKNLRIMYPKIDICLYSNIQDAFYAWKLQIFHFDEISSFKSLDLKTSYNKYVLKKGGSDREYIIKTRNGIIRLPFDSINCFIAQGGYTKIRLKGNKSITETKQLGKYMVLCDRDPNLIRFGRSLIINLRNVKKVGNKLIEFYNSDYTLTISKNMEAKIKKVLLS